LEKSTSYEVSHYVVFSNQQELLLFIIYLCELAEYEILHLVHFLWLKIQREHSIKIYSIHSILK
jgi:hypothetical protein